MSSVATKLSNFADGTSSEAQALLMDMRKAVNTMKSVAVAFEKDEKFDKVKKLEEEVMELLASYEDCGNFAEAVKAAPQAYQPSDQPTDFKRLMEAEVNRVKGGSRVSEQSQQLLRQFREAVWGVHHSGQPMPGDEQEDIVMTSTQNSIINLLCPLTGKSITLLTDPIRCVECRHIYEKDAILDYIRKQKPPRCPVSGCPRILQVGKLGCDALLRIEIDELRSSEPAGPKDVEDVEDVDGDSDNNE